MSRFDRAAFDATVESWGLEYFSPRELLGSVGNVVRGSKNMPPPRSLWKNCRDVARVADEIRRRLGKPIIITSSYRSPNYNRAVGGVSRSQHKEFRALDIRSSRARPMTIARIAKQLRDEGFFSGGIGVYNGFVHIDTRGENRTWGIPIR